MKYFHDQVFNDSMFLCMYYCLTLYDHPFCFFHASLYKVISSWSKVHALEGKNWLLWILRSSLNFLQWNCTMLRNHCTKLSSIQESTIIIFLCSCFIVQSCITVFKCIMVQKERGMKLFQNIHFSLNNEPRWTSWHLGEVWRFKCSCQNESFRVNYFVILSIMELTLLPDLDIW